MLKYLVILAIGVAIGYGYGWNDAQVNDKSISERILDRIGSETSARVGNGIDAKKPGADGK